ncbi:MAG TPA: class I SAM-dependent methyltransferase [Thermomicrobiales bacterium]
MTEITDIQIPAIETSNFRKHTHPNPIQRRLIDRFHHVIAARVAELNPRTFLDAGCGEGFVAGVLLRQFPGMQITGFDFNPASVAVAQRQVPGATFLTASIFDIPFPDDSFDVVGCFEVLEHQTDPSPALRELARVAREAVVLSVPHEPYFCLANMARGKNLDVRPRGSDPDHKQFWTRRAFAEFVTQSGMLDIEWLGGSFPWTICVARKRR